MNKKAQVWVETVIYTLIALVMIGAVLTFVRPKIQEIQDKTLLDQTIEVMKGIDETVKLVVNTGAGNKKIVEFTLKRGELLLDCENNNMKYILEETKLIYSEQCIKETCLEEDWVSIGNIKALTKKNGKLNIVTLKIEYPATIDLLCENANELKTIEKSATPYKLSIENKGASSAGAAQEINLEIIS